MGDDTWEPHKRSFDTSTVPKASKFSSPTLWSFGRSGTTFFPPGSTRWNETGIAGSRQRMMKIFTGTPSQFMVVLILTTPRQYHRAFTGTYALFSWCPRCCVWGECHFPRILHQHLAPCPDLPTLSPESVLIRFESLCSPTWTTLSPCVYHLLESP